MPEIMYVIVGFIIGLLFSWMWLERRMSAELDVQKSELAERKQLTALEVDQANEDNQELREKLIALETVHNGCEHERNQLLERIAALEASSKAALNEEANNSEVATLRAQLADERQRRQALRTEFERIEAQLARSNLGSLQLGGDSVALHEDAKPFESMLSTGSQTDETKPSISDEAEALFILPADSDPDDLKKIKGIGPVLERKLNSLGITTFSQIAKLDDNGVAEIDAVLNFKGRIQRERWIEQARGLI